MREEKKRVKETRSRVRFDIYLNRSTIFAPLPWIEYDAMSASWLDDPYITDLFTAAAMAPRYVSQSRVYAGSIVFSCESGIMRAGLAHKSELLAPPIAKGKKGDLFREDADTSRLRHVDVKIHA